MIAEERPKRIDVEKKRAGDGEMQRQRGQLKVGHSQPRCDQQEKIQIPLK